MPSQAKTSLLAALTSLALFAGGCGDNVLKSSETEDPAEDATLALERGDEDKAIEILEDALSDDPENATFLSILALAHAQRAGVEPLAFAQRISSSSSSTSDTSATPQVGGSYAVMFEALPEASEANLADIDESVTILTSIAADQHLPGDDFKLALYMTASMFLHIKVLDTDGDGTLSIDEVLNLSDANATGLLTQLLSAQSVLGAGDASDPAIAKAASALGKYQDQIDAQEGATNEEKLKNYLAANPAAAAQAQQ